MTDDLPEDDRERADAVREKRHERSDPNGRVRRVRAQGEPPEDLDLDLDVDTDGDGADAAGGPELPDPVREEFDEIRKKLQYGLDQEFDVEMETDAHYWPLVVHLGVERLKGMWLEEVRRTMETIEGVDAPGDD